MEQVETVPCLEGDLLLPRGDKVIFENDGVLLTTPFCWYQGLSTKQIVSKSKLLTSFRTNMLLKFDLNISAHQTFVEKVMRLEEEGRYCLQRNSQKWFSKHFTKQCTNRFFRSVLHEETKDGMILLEIPMKTIATDIKDSDGKSFDYENLEIGSVVQMKLHFFGLFFRRDYFRMDGQVCGGIVSNNGDSEIEKLRKPRSVSFVNEDEEMCDATTPLQVVSICLTTPAVDELEGSRIDHDDNESDISD